MNIVILGAAGFIGTNLALKLSQDENNFITVVDETLEYFNACLNRDNIRMQAINYFDCRKLDAVIAGNDVLYHLVSTNNPTSSNRHIGTEIEDNIDISIKIFDSCVKNRIKKVLFISSGGTVYGNVEKYPIVEDDTTNPITTYGIQKLTIEKILYLYGYIHGLNYAIARVSNPYGPYQRPNGRLGVVTTFAYKAYRGEPLTVYGDGGVVRDYIYIDDVVDALIKIANSDISGKEKIYNVGSGTGVRVSEIIEIIGKILGTPIHVDYNEKRKVDVPVNYLDVSRYEKQFGKLVHVRLEEGVNKLIMFFATNEFTEQGLWIKSQ